MSRSKPLKARSKISVQRTANRVARKQMLSHIRAVERKIIKFKDNKTALEKWERELKDSKSRLLVIMNNQEKLSLGKEL